MRTACGVSVTQDETNVAPTVFVVDDDVNVREGLKALLESVGLQAGWELDLFGANRAARDAAQARLEGAQAGWHDARVAVAARRTLPGVPAIAFIAGDVIATADESRTVTCTGAEVAESPLSSYATAVRR